MLDESGGIPKRIMEELRETADKAKLSGRFDAGVRLHALLDAHEDQDQVPELDEKVKDLTREAEQNAGLVSKALEKLEKLSAAVAKISDDIEEAEGIESPQLKPLEGLKDLIGKVKDHLDETEFTYDD